MTQKTHTTIQQHEAHQTAGWSLVLRLGFVFQVWYLYSGDLHCRWYMNNKRRLINMWKHLVSIFLEFDRILRLLFVPWCVPLKMIYAIFIISKLLLPILTYQWSKIIYKKYNYRFLIHSSFNTSFCIVSIHS